MLHMNQEETIPYQLRHRQEHRSIKVGEARAFRFAGSWKTYVIAFVLVVGAGFLYLHYQNPAHVVSANLLHPDDADFKAWQSDELGKLKLRAAVATAVKDLNLAVRYQKKGWISNPELFNEGPVKFQLVRTGAPIAAQFELSMKNRNTYMLKHGKGDAAEFEFNTIYTTEIGSWMITRTPAYAAYYGQTMIIDVQNPELVTEKLFIGLLSEMDTNNPGFTQFSVKDPVQSRGEAFLNKVISQLNTSLAEERATKAAIDIKQLDQQLMAFNDKVDSLQAELNALSGTARDLEQSPAATNYLKLARKSEIARNEVAFKRSALEDLTRYLKQQNLLTVLPPSSAALADPKLDALLRQLIALQSQSQQLLQSHLRTDPVFKPLVQQTAKIRTLMTQQIGSIAATLQKKSVAVASSDIRAAGMLQLMPPMEKKLVLLKRKQLNYENQYAFLLKRKEEILLKQAAQKT
eukprot:TRINITY_DN5466_c0_g2_i1.p1 TRINITY_DN5466_c0_g2~~TRINITY_DN5466_c0_g2_i1.p1  ORF type:complete len:462 (+),score=71.56 TRINITY_DN5466_c0_g2_i1:1249-2634(+)